MVVRELVALLGVKTDPTSFKQANFALENLVGFARGAAGAIAGFFAIKWTKDAIDQVTEFGDSLTDLTNKTGIATEELQKLKFAAEQSGSSFEDVQTAIKKLQLWQEKIVQGGREEFKTFYQLGVSVTKTEGGLKSATDLLMEVADAFQKVNSDSERTALAIKIFGKSGTSLIPFLRGGSAGIRGLFTELEDLGGIMSEDMVAASDKYRDNLAKLKVGFMGVKIAIAEELLPKLIELQEQAISWWKENKIEVKATIKDLDKLASVLAVVLKLLWDIGVVLKDVFTSIPGIALLGAIGFKAMTSAKGIARLSKYLGGFLKIVRFLRSVVGGALIALTLWTMIFRSFGQMVKDGTGKAAELFDALSYIFGFDVATPVKEIVKWFQLLFSDPMVALRQFVADWKMLFETLWAATRSAVSKIWNFLKTFVANVSGFFKELFSIGWSEIGAFWSGVFDIVVNWLNKIWTIAAEWWDKIVSFPKRAAAWLSEKFGWSGVVNAEAAGNAAALTRATLGGGVTAAGVTATTGGARVDQKTEIRFDIKAAPGMSEKKLADEISKRVSNEVERQNRAALRALVPGTVGA